ncbi:MAG: hypothetical protein HFI86_03085 [Bacilli bacterium]|nr:hypothetical protein [Bacilli bacterium]MCI9434249.1 hypothetical protein [Bacilli bacterium]
MKKSIIILFLTLITLLMSGCSMPFASNEETITCKMDFIFNMQADATFKDDKLIKCVLVQKLDTSDMTKEEIDLMKQSMSNDTKNTAGVAIKIEEKNGAIINTIIYDIAKMTDEELEERGMSKNMTKEEYEKMVKESGMVCD